MGSPIPFILSIVTFRCSQSNKAAPSRWRAAVFEAALSLQRLVKMTFASFRWSTASDRRLERYESKFKTTITICTFVNSGG